MSLEAHSDTVSNPSDSSSSTAAQFPDLSPSSPLPVLIRATNGNSESPKSGKITRNKREQIKLATVVQPGDLEGFFVRYGEVWRKEMGGLKKRDRKKKKKEKKGDGAKA
jgi:signal recognition particle subunit SRP14